MSDLNVIVDGIVININDWFLNLMKKDKWAIYIDYNALVDKLDEEDKT